MSEPTDLLKNALLALAEPERVKPLNPKHWQVIYETTRQLAGLEGQPVPGLRSFDLAIREAAADFKLKKWLLQGKLAGHAFRLAHPGSAKAWIRRALYLRCIDEVRKADVRRAHRERLVHEPTAPLTPDHGRLLDPAVHALIDDRLPPHLREFYPRKDPPTVQGRLHTRYDVVRGKTCMEDVITAELAANPDPKPGAERRCNERLMRGQRRATETCAALGRTLAERLPPHDDGPPFIHLADLLRHKKARRDGGAS